MWLVDLGFSKRFQCVGWVFQLRTGLLIFEHGNQRAGASGFHDPTCWRIEMVNLKRASDELFSREPDECFDTLSDLREHCFNQKENSGEHWCKPQNVIPIAKERSVSVQLEIGEEIALNDWSFRQLSRLCGVSADTLNRLTPKTAAIAIGETLPSADRPIQFFAGESSMRSVHGISYTRLWNSELLNVVAKFESEFQPPKKAFNGHGTGLYAGDQDMFAFLIDDNAWVDIGDDKFAPGLFIWNSETGSRSLGCSTFWYQHICSNHIVWGCTEVNEFKRKHTASVRDGLGEIERMIESLVEVKTRRQERFVDMMKQATTKTLGSDLDEVSALLRKQGIPLKMIKNAANVVGKNHTAFAWVDALTRASGAIKFAGARSAIDQKIGSILSLAV